MKKRILSFLLSAVMLLSAPAAMAEEAVASYYAGELTTTVVSDSYVAGEQINLDVAFGVDAVKAFQSANGLTADGKCGPMTLQVLFGY